MTEEQIYGFSEVLADISYDCGYRRLRLSNDSRVKISEMIAWAKEFSEYHKNTDWTQVEYLDMIQQFIDSKINMHQHSINCPCPCCGVDTLVCEIVDSPKEFFSVQCTTCDQYWQDFKAISALSGVDRWDKELFGERAKKALTFLLSEWKTGTVYTSLRHDALCCVGVFQDKGKFVAFDNRRSDCFVEEFNLMNTAIMWMRGEIEISDREQYE